MNGYVTVVFSNDKYATNYTYMVPDNICMRDIQRYVVVENYFYDESKMVSPYIVAKVTGYYDACPKGAKATKYIVDTIDGELISLIDNLLYIVRMRQIAWIIILIIFL